MSPKLKREIESNALAVRCCKIGLANLLKTEAERFRAKRAELIVKNYDAKTMNLENLRLVRDHEVRAETFKAAASLISA